MLSFCQNPTYGVDISTPVFKTGPLILLQDNDHGVKTARNNEYSGTHLITLGRSVITFGHVVDLFKRSVSWAEAALKEGRPPARVLKARDIFKVDKQDDGAARRFFHSYTLQLMTHLPVRPDGSLSTEPEISEGFEGMFSFHYVFGASIISLQ